MTELSSNTPPLAGKRIVVTRARAQASALADRLVELGATVIELPSIDIAPVPLEALDAALERIGYYDWLLFTSVNAVNIVFDRIDALDVEPGELASVSIGAIGRSSAERVRDRGGSVAFMPDEAVAESMLQGLLSRGVAGARVLLPRARTARNVLPDGLRAAGATVDVVAVYETRKPQPSSDALRQLQVARVDCVTFTSGSSVRNTLESLGGRLPEGARVACIGPVTAEVARAAGLKVDILATEFSAPGLIDALVAHFEMSGKVGQA